MSEYQRHVGTYCRQPSQSAPYNHHDKAWPKIHYPLEQGKRPTVGKRILIMEQAVIIDGTFDGPPYRQGMRRNKCAGNTIIKPHKNDLLSGSKVPFGHVSPDYATARHQSQNPCICRHASTKRVAALMHRQNTRKKAAQNQQPFTNLDAIDSENQNSRCTKSFLMLF